MRSSNPFGSSRRRKRANDKFRFGENLLAACSTLVDQHVCFSTRRLAVSKTGLFINRFRPLSNKITTTFPQPDKLPNSFCHLYLRSPTEAFQQFSATYS